MNIFIEQEFRSLIPPLSAEELTALESSILKEGLRDSIVVWKEKSIIVDGHNRYDICTKHNIPIPDAKILQKSFADDSEVREWIIRNQFSRRNLAPYQRAVLALRLEEIIAAKAKMKQIKSGGAVHQKSDEPPMVANKELAKVANVSHDTIYKVKEIEAKATPEQKAALSTGDATINAVYVQVKKVESVQKVLDSSPLLPKTKYRVLVIDPPWQMTKITREVRPDQQQMDYSMMSQAELLALPIPALAAEDGCHIYLWTTHKHLPDALELFKGWGVNYQCVLTWVKNVGFTPFSWMYSTEMCLFGRIGNLPLLVNGKRQDFNAKVREHSRKPEEFYDLVKTVSPGPRLDMFAREEHDGYEPWGNETCKFSAD